MDLDAGRNLKHINTECLIDIKGRDICNEYLWKILWQTLNLDFMDDLIKNTACLASNRCSLELDAHMCPDGMASCDLIEINMMNAVSEEILLECLDEYLMLLVTLHCKCDKS